MYKDYGPRKPYKRVLSQHIKEMKPDVDEDTLGLLEGLLTMDPVKRLTAEKALAHPFFKNKPLPLPLS
jgi:hypothetical protein